MITVTKDNTKTMKKAVELLTEMEVLVGVPEDKDARKSGGDINNAALAYIHDNGAPEANIPARPFMRPGIKDAQDRVVKRLEMAAKAAFRGDLEGVRANFEAAGLLAQNGVRARINEGIPPPLKAGTIAARRRRGRSGTKPLIDTGQLRNAITYVIRKRKEKIMPQLNLAHVARSARFAERLTIIRRQETVGNDGILTLVPTTITPAPYGTVTADSSNLVRGEDQQHMPKSISVVTPFKLRGPSNSGSNSYQPDIIVWRGDQYIVERLDDYSAYGEGWTQAICASIDAIDIAPPGP